MHSHPGKHQCKSFKIQLIIWVFLQRGPYFDGVSPKTDFFLKVLKACPRKCTFKLLKQYVWRDVQILFFPQFRLTSVSPES
jgi:hypothetical protein